MEKFEQEKSQDGGFWGLGSRLLEEVFEHEKLRSSEQVVSKGNQEGSLTEKVQTAFAYLDTLPDGLEFDPALAIKAYEFLGGSSLPPMAKTLLEGVTKISKTGQRVQITREGDINLDINMELLAGQVKVKSLNLGSVGFELGGDAKAPRLKNIEGLSLEVEIGGSAEKIAIKDLSLSQGDNGKLVLNTEIENPAPRMLRWALQLPERIPLSLVLSAEGAVEGMEVAQALNTAAEAAGRSLPGLLIGNMLRMAALAARLADKHPELAKAMLETAFPLPSLIVSGVDDPSDLASIALAVSPAGTAFKAAKVVAEHSDEIIDLAGDVVETAFKASPAGLAYDLIFGD